MSTPTIPSQDAPSLGVSPVRQPDVTIDEAAELPAKLQFRLAAWLRISGQLARATALLDAMEPHAGDSAGFLDERAALALASGDAGAVREAWQKRLDARSSPSAQAGYARALLELGEIEEATSIGDGLVAEHWELATVRSLAAELAFQQGDLAAAHDFWASELANDETRVAPLLAMARISLLGGDPDEARGSLTRAIAEPEQLTAAQLAAAAGLAELLGQPARGQTLRWRAALLEVARAAALAMEIDEALGRETDNQPLPSSTASSSDGNARGAEIPADPTANSDDLDLLVETPEPEPADPRVLETLRAVFGYDALRPGQAAVINQVLAGQDTLAILPTGAGKSLTFQLSSLLLPGATLVLSPLIALMKDQIDGLPPALRERAVLVNSTLSPEQQRQALDEIAAGTRSLVYAAPERLRQPAFLRALRQAGVSLVVVDEAHCISLWGHDFRPDYLSIPAALPEIGNPPLLAMTATASPETADSLAAGFRRNLAVVRTSAFRPNLFYSAEKLGTKEEKARRIVTLCREQQGQGVVYVSSRRDAENLAGVLGDNGVSAVPYHAGLDRQRRAYNQDRFMSGAARVVVATVAFGMGIDKPDVRFIIHFSPSTSLEAYAQESGRAGRDGKPSRCVLLYTSQDRANQTRLARRDAMDLDTLRQVYAGVKRHAIGSWAIFEPSRIVLPTGDDPDERPDPRIGLGLLEQGGLLERHPNAPVTWRLTPVTAPEGDYAPAIPDDLTRWESFAAWAGVDDGRHGGTVIQTAAACSELGITPEALARILDEHPAWEATEGDRLTCLHLLPVEANAGVRLQRVLDEAAARAKARVDRTIRYAEGRRCRHVELAAHLGERLRPCGEACDVCTGQQSSASTTRTRKDKGPAKRNRHTEADALLALKALASAPFPVGKTGLVRLLEGSIQSRIQGDRSAYFGALEDLQKSKIAAMIDELVQDESLAYDRSREFPVLRITPQGMQAMQGSE